MADDEIKTPDCPRCGQPPAITFAVPYFCSNDECEVVHWDPTMTLAEIRALEPKVVDFDAGSPFSGKPE